MTEPNNRVLGRVGARALAECEIEKVGGCESGPIITELVTNFGRDFSTDHLENQ